MHVLYNWKWFSKTQQKLITELQTIQVRLNFKLFVFFVSGTYIYIEKVKSHCKNVYIKLRGTCDTNYNIAAVAFFWWRHTRTLFSN